MANVRIGIIGTGNWGQNHVRNFSNLRNSQLVACCDTSADKLEAMKRSYPSILLYSDYVSLVKSDLIDAVVIASSAPTHYMIAKEALLNNKHVFVEKPMALRSSDAQELTEIAAEKKLTLMVGHLLEYHPAVEKLKTLITSGEIGEIFYIYSQRINLGVIRKEENALWSFGPHDVSIILYLIDEEPCAVSAHGESFLQKNVEDVVFVTLRFKSNKIANIQLSWLDPHKVRKTTIVGSKKMVVFDDVDPSEKIKVYDKGVTFPTVSYYESLQPRVGDIWIPRIQMKEPLQIESAHFIDCILTGAQPRSDGYDGLRVTRVLEAAQNSLEHNGALIKINNKKETLV